MPGCVLVHPEGVAWGGANGTFDHSCPPLPTTQLQSGPQGCVSVQQRSLQQEVPGQMLQALQANDSSQDYLAVPPRAQTRSRPGWGINQARSHPGDLTTPHFI